MSERVRIRMYRHGLGDCFLLSFPTDNGGFYRVMIDCGVILGQPKAVENMRKVVADIFQESGGVIDLLVATHEHWDHISGFAQAWEPTIADNNTPGNGKKTPERDGLKHMTFKQLWLGWTEDPTDPKAKRLADGRKAALAALDAAAVHLAVAGSAGVSELEPFLQQLGLTAAARTPDAMANIKTIAKIRYRRPSDPPEELPGTNVRVFVLAPPMDEKLLRTLSKSSNNPVMYGLDASTVPVRPVARPFGDAQTLPLEASHQVPFFQQHYFGTDVQQESDDAPAWRRIDDAWLGSASDLALQLDAYTNNTSLVLCFQFDNGDTMLFPGDAQIGSWLSWPKLKWVVPDEKRGDQTITGAELLEQCVLYKVGHHGSHNATARQDGLQTMKRLKQAIIPVDEAEAKRKRWNHMPLPAILDELERLAEKGVIRADDTPADSDPKLYVDITI